MQKIRIIGFFFENRLYWQSEEENSFYEWHFLGYLSFYLSGLVTAVAVFRNPNTIPFCLGYVFIYV